MNERNVEALRALIRQWQREHGHDGKVPLSDWLPSQGVLVPSALTDRDLAGFYPEPIDIPSALECIAKGEK